MPIYMDVHRLEGGVTPLEVEQAHLSDLEAQEKYGVRYLKYWFNQEAGSVFCLIDAPEPDAAVAVHREAHGMIADKLIQVDEVVLNAFLGDGGEKTAGAAALLPGGDGQTLDGGLRIILFTDLEGSTATTNRLGDAEAMKVLRSHNAIVREALAEWRGKEVKHTGDGVMASFLSCSDAAGCAIAIQQRLAKHNSEQAAEPISVRIGFTAGEPVSDNEDLFGASVQLAARICAHAHPGQILVSNVIKELSIGKGLAFVDHGEVALKGFDHPVHLHEVGWSA